MATKRKKKTAHRRRRVGAAKSNLTTIAMKAGGVAGGVFAAGLVTKTLSTLDPKILGGLLLGGGLFLTAKAKSPLLEGLGFGLAAKGANSLMTSFGVINGIGAVPMVSYRGRGAGITSAVGNLSGTGSRTVGAMTKGLATIGAMFDN